MRIVVVGNTAVKVPDGASDWRTAQWVNPGILPDEFITYDVIEIGLHELEDDDA